MLLDGQLSWRKCPVASCLAALVLVGLWQITPLPRGLLGRISPVTARMYDRLLPAQPEVLPFGEPRGDLDAARRIDAQRLSRRHAAGAGQAPGGPAALRGRPATSIASAAEPAAPGHRRPDQRVAAGALRAGPGLLLGPRHRSTGLTRRRGGRRLRPVRQPEPLRVLS